MTALDRAFIKAYSHHWRPAAGAAGASSTAAHAGGGASAGQTATTRLAHGETFRNTLRMDSGSRTPSTYVDAPSAGIRPLSAFTSSPQRHALQPLLEVDCFEWPEACDRLAGTARGAIQQFVDTLLSRAAAGQNVVAIASPGRSQGATTATITLARALAGRASCALVDADLGNPQLARTLGVLAEGGWNDAALAHLPLEEVMIASAADQLVLAPLRADQGQQADGQQLAVTLELLRDSYDLVLIDAGPIVELLDWAAGLPVDGHYLVCDSRGGGRQQLHTVCKWLKTEGISPQGIVDNFSTSAAALARS